MLKQGTNFAADDRDTEFLFSCLSSRLDHLEGTLRLVLQVGVAETGSLSH